MSDLKCLLVHLGLGKTVQVKCDDQARTIVLNAG